MVILNEQEPIQAAQLELSIPHRIKPPVTETSCDTESSLTYEFPLNELIRVCLRLEQLFTKAYTFCQQPYPASSHMAMLCITDILAILNRPELKSKLLQELKRHLNRLKSFQDQVNVNTEYLSEVIREVTDNINQLYVEKGRLGQTLANDNILTVINQHLHGKAGKCDVEPPAYTFWLNQIPAKRQASMEAWLKQLKPAQDATQLLLRLVRQSRPAKRVTVNQGFYQLHLGNQNNCQLIQLTLPSRLGIIPEISAGLHRFCIRFTDIEQQKAPSSDFDIELTCCGM